MASSKAQPTGRKVAIVGAGMMGLIASKNLLEQGLDVTTYEKNDYIGGNWHASLNTEQTTALPITTMNTSKHASAFSDFPFPAEAPLHPPAKDLEKYFTSFAERFDLLRHIQFSRAVTKIERDDNKNKWIVYTRDAAEPESTSTAQAFDRLIIANGTLNTPHIVKLKGADQFAGDMLHSRQFKDPSKFRGKNVIVVGAGATAADSVTFLKIAKAGKIYFSHRGSFRLLPRTVEGKAMDHSMTRRSMVIGRWIACISPSFFAKIMGKVMLKAQHKAYPQLIGHESFAPSRRLDPPSNRVPVFSTDLANNLVNGSAKTVTGISHISGARSVTLVDGTTLTDIDAIIICSGYTYDFSLMPPVADPSNPDNAPDGFSRFRSAPFYSTQNTPFARLYQGFLSELYPDSLAFLGHVLILKPAFPFYDLTSMALAQLWSGGYPLPSPEAMAKDINSHYALVISLLHKAPVTFPGFRLNSRSTYAYLNDVAGTGVNDRLASCRLPAWKLWWEDRKFYNLLMDGVDSPHVYRLFDTGRGRKVWSGARAAIEKANDDVKELHRAWKEEQKKEGNATK